MTFSLLPTHPGIPCSTRASNNTNKTKITKELIYVLVEADSIQPATNYLSLVVILAGPPPIQMEPSSQF